MAIDFTRSSSTIIFDLLKSANPNTPLTQANYSYGAPATGTVSGKNTDLTLTAVANSGFTGTQTIHYNRMDLNSVPGSRSKVFLSGSAVNISDLISAINSRYGIKLGASDYVDGPLPAFSGSGPNEEKTFTLTAAAGSLVWIGAVTLTISSGEMTMVQAMPNNDLNGLTYVAPA